MIVFVKHFVTYYPTLNPQAESMLVAAVLLLLQAIQIEVVEMVFHEDGMRQQFALEFFWSINLMLHCRHQ